MHAAPAFLGLFLALLTPRFLAATSTLSFGELTSGLTHNFVAIMRFRLTITGPFTTILTLTLVLTFQLALALTLALTALGLLLALALTLGLLLGFFRLEFTVALTSIGELHWSLQ